MRIKHNKIWRSIFADYYIRDYVWFNCGNLNWILCHAGEWDDKNALVSCAHLDSAEKIRDDIKEQANLSVSLSEKDGRYNIRLIFDNEADEALFMMKESV